MPTIFKKEKQQCVTQPPSTKNPDGKQRVLNLQNCHKTVRFFGHSLLVIKFCTLLFANCDTESISKGIF